jgi:hypothetical protein
VHFDSNNSSDFKIVLPFLFTNPVAGSGLQSIFINNTATHGDSLLVFGGGNVTSYYQVLVPPVLSFDFSGRSVSDAGKQSGFQFR